MKKTLLKRTIRVLLLGLNQAWPFEVNKKDLSMILIATKY
jgi:hypothetical protein